MIIIVRRWMHQGWIIRSYIDSCCGIITPSDIPTQKRLLSQLYTKGDNHYTISNDEISHLLCAVSPPLLIHSRSSGFVHPRLYCPTMNTGISRLRAHVLAPSLKGASSRLRGCRWRHPQSFLPGSDSDSYRESDLV